MSTPSGDGPLAPRRIARLFAILAGLIEPRSELDFHDHFELLVAVVLSAQTTDRAVNRAMARMRAHSAITPRALAQLGEDGLRPLIADLGLFQAKARHVAALAAIIADHHGGRVPAERAALEALPGVGRKTASVVLNIAFQIPTIAVDTHVHRVANRTGIATTSSPEATQTVLERRVPSRHRLHAHHYLILHGRYTCTARRPHCDDCPIRRCCYLVSPD